MFCAVYLQHHKGQLEVFIWVKNRFKNFLCKKINILVFFTKNVPLNSQAFLGIRICDKIIFRYGHIIWITLKFEEISFEPEKKWKRKVVQDFWRSVYYYIFLHGWIPRVVLKSLSKKDHLSRVMRKPFFCICEKTKKLTSAFVFATRIVQSFDFLNPKFQAFSHLLWLYSPICVGPGRTPRRPIFSWRSSFILIQLEIHYIILVF